MKIGYARVSSQTQNIERQIEELLKYGCEHIYQETISGVSRSKKELKKLLEKSRPGDVVVVSDLSRLSRKSKELLEIVEYFKKEKVTLISLKEGIDTSQNKMVNNLIITVLSGLYEYDLEVQKKRQQDGIKTAQRRGKYKGRKEKYTKEHPKIKIGFEMYERGEPISEIIETIGISRSTFYDKIHKYEITRELTNVN